MMLEENSQYIPHIMQQFANANNLCIIVSCVILYLQGVPNVSIHGGKLTLFS